MSAKITRVALIVCTSVAVFTVLYMSASSWSSGTAVIGEVGHGATHAIGDAAASVVPPPASSTAPLRAASTRGRGAVRQGVPGARSLDLGPATLAAGAAVTLRRPKHPNLAALPGRQKVIAVRRYRKEMAAWLAQRRKRGRVVIAGPLMRARRWAMRLLKDPEMMHMRLTQQQQKDLVMLYEGIVVEARAVADQIYRATTPIFEERIAAGHYTERSLAAERVLRVPGVMHRTAVGAARDGSGTTVRKVVAIAPGESSKVDLLRAEQMRIRALALQSLNERSRAWKSRN